MILSILDIKKVRRNYLLYSLFLIVLAIIYESFSHGVYSNYMIFSFIIPFIYGFCGSFLINIGGSKLGNTFYNLGIITLSIGSVFKGILEIYGTTNILLYVYIVIGLFMAILGIIVYLCEYKNDTKR